MKSVDSIGKTRTLYQVIIGEGHIEMDPKKVEVIKSWKAPVDFMVVRSFLGQANYYQKLMRDYSKIALRLTGMLNKGENGNGNQMPGRI